MASSMSTSEAAEGLTEIITVMERQMSALQQQVSKLKVCQTTLVQQHSKRYQNRGSQAEQGPQFNPLRHVKRLDHAQPFGFQQPSKKINWKKLRQLDLQGLAASGDTAAAMQLFEDVAYGDVESGSIYDLSEASLLKMIRLAQLQLQYMQYKLEEKVETELALEDDSLAIAAGLSGLAAPSLGDIHKGLGALESDIKQLGCHRVDGLIQQVRIEERHAAKSALMEAIQKSKQHVDLNYGVEVVTSSTKVVSE